MPEVCSFYDRGRCHHPVVGPNVVHEDDCARCIAFNGRDSPELQAMSKHRDSVQQNQPTHNWRGKCIHLGAQKNCCNGRLFVCRQKASLPANGSVVVLDNCVRSGMAPEPVRVCDSCDDWEPRLPDRNRFAGKCVAITSLSPNPLKQRRQALCVRSWRDIGLEVIVVNTSDEADLVGDELRELITVHVSDDVTTYYGKPTQSIPSMVRAGIERGIPFMLINSDIEISGDDEHIANALNQPDCLTIGIRYNHEPGSALRDSLMERSGLDVFLMTPEMASTLPLLPFGIGRPVWDYWLPHHFQALGHDINWINQPFFFHERHELAWSKVDLELGYNLLIAEYGLSEDCDFIGMRNGFDKKKAKV